MEDLFTVDFSFGEVHCILAHCKSIPDRRAQSVGLDEHGTSVERVACALGTSCELGIFVRITGERDGSEVCGNLSLGVAVESLRAVGIDTEHVVRAVIVLTEC